MLRSPEDKHLVKPGEVLPCVTRPGPADLPPPNRTLKLPGALKFIRIFPDTGETSGKSRLRGTGKTVWASAVADGILNRMKEKRSFRRSNAHSSPGSMKIGDRTIFVDFDNISLIGARVRARGEKLPPVGSLATLNMENEGFEVSCKVVGLDNGEYYRLKFDGLTEGSLPNLMNLLSRLSNGSYRPEEELPKLVLEMTD